jgi:RNA polymerase sigma-70 factor (ECF subfamily)
LFGRYVTPLNQWARGRLPRWVRDVADTTDLVQDTLLQTFRRIDQFEPARDGALLAYLRQAVRNRVRLEFRHKRRRPERIDLDSHQPDPAPSPLEQAAAACFLDDYERALDRLRPEDRDLVVARLELEQSYADIAAATGRPNANAARSAVVRALVHLAQEMQRNA